MDKNGYDKIKQLLGKDIYVDPEPEEEEDLRYVEVSIGHNSSSSPAKVLNKLGQAGLMAFERHSIPEFAPIEPAFRLIGQSSTYTGPGGLRHYLTLEDLNNDPVSIIG